MLFTKIVSDIENQYCRNDYGHSNIITDDPYVVNNIYYYFYFVICYPLNWVIYYKLLYLQINYINRAIHYLEIIKNCIVTSGYEYVCVTIVMPFITMIHVIIGYLQFLKYICHISQNDKTKIHASIANIHFPHTLFIHNASQLVYLQKNHAIDINKLEEKNKACSWPNVYPVYSETWATLGYTDSYCMKIIVENCMYSMYQLNDWYMYVFTSEWRESQKTPCHYLITHSIHYLFTTCNCMLVLITLHEPMAIWLISLCHQYPLLYVYYVHH